MIRSALALALALVACTPSATPPAAPPLDASDGGDLASNVCTHLDSVGCAQPRTCATAFRAHQGVTTDFKPACLLAADSPAAVNACGTLRCSP